MRSKLRDAMIYLCYHYPHKNELSKARLTKMIYLADWRSAITRGQQITSTEWLYNHYGPYVGDIEHLALDDAAFETEPGTNHFGSEKTIIRVRPGFDVTGLSDDDKQALDHVIRETSSMHWNEFVQLVYSTYPILTQDRYSQLDLVGLAADYKRVRKEFGWDLEDQQTAQVSV